MQLVNSDARVMLLYCTKDEANEILKVASELHLTGENFVWVVTQSVIENAQPKSSFPPGMLGVHFDTSSTGLVNEISTALKVYALGVENFLTDPANKGYQLNTHGLSCEGEGRGRWDTGEIFYRYLRNVSLEGENSKPNIEFTTGESCLTLSLTLRSFFYETNSLSFLQHSSLSINTTDGDLKSAELKIMNLRPGVTSKGITWEEIGVWKSWLTNPQAKLDIRDIYWP